MDCFKVFIIELASGIKCYAKRNVLGISKDGTEVMNVELNLSESLEM